MLAKNDPERRTPSSNVTGPGGEELSVRSGAPAKARRRRWRTPAVEALPRLTQLTLQTGDPIGGSGDTGSGSTVF